MIDPERARETLENLSALGVRLSLDDFGAGYTSLSQLTTLPVSELKIDRSFVMTMTQDHNNALIVQGVDLLGHNLGLTLVSEGVENEHALTALAGLGCDVAQGFHICRPIPADDFNIWSAGRRITPMPCSDLRAAIGIGTATPAKRPVAGSDAASLANALFPDLAFGT